MKNIVNIALGQPGQLNPQIRLLCIKRHTYATDEGKQDVLVCKFGRCSISCTIRKVESQICQNAPGTA